MFYWFVGILVFFMVAWDCIILAGESAPNRTSLHNDGEAAMWYTISFGVLIAIAFGYHGSLRWDTLAWLKDHPFHIAGSVVGYLGCGILHTFCFVPKFVAVRYGRLRQIREDWDKSLNLKDMYPTIEVYIDSRYFYGIKTNSDVPHFSEYGILVGRRIAWWWAYILNWVIGEVLLDFAAWIGRVGLWIAARLRGVYDGLARATIAGIKRGL